MGESFSGSLGELLKRFRKRCRLTQQQLATALGVHRTTIGRWEEGSFLPESKALVLDLAKHLRLNEQETRQLLEASLTALTPHWSVPLPRNPFFTGREKILEALHTQLSIDQSVALPRSSALYGLGGMGKTQIALEYAYRHALEYSAVFWIGAESREQITASLLLLAETIPLPERHATNQQRALGAVQRWLAAHHHWLLIWDNLDDPALLQDFLLPMRPGAILITTRRRALGLLPMGIDLRPMGQEEGIRFLFLRANMLASPEQMDQYAEHAPGEYAAAGEIVMELGGLPLALDQAGAYLEETGCGFLAYLQCYTQQRALVLSRRGTSERYHPQSVVATIQLSLEQVEQAQPAAGDLLRVCAFVQAEAIPEEFFVMGAAHLGSQLEALGADPIQFDQAIAVLRCLSLIQRQAETHTLSLHRLVQAVLLDAMTQGEREQWTWRVIAALDAGFPEVLPAADPTAWTHCEKLLPHSMIVLCRARDGEESLTVASLAYKVAQYLRERGRYSEAEPLFQLAQSILERSLGPEHPDVARILNYLAVLYVSQSRYAEAEALYLRALHIWGPPDVARPLNNLAELYVFQGKYAQAKALHQRALHIWKQALGPNHPLVVTSLVNLAYLGVEQGRYANAERLYQRALSLLDHNQRPEHPLAAVALKGLARLYQIEGNYREAEPLYQRAIHIQERFLGLEHPDLGTTLNGLAELFLITGKYAEAELLSQRARSILERSLGPEHPSVALTLRNLANLNRDQGRDAEAASLYQHTLHIQEQKLGQQHPKTAQTLYDLALLRRKQGRLFEAVALTKRALYIREATLGERHLHTLSTRELYTHLVQEQSRSRGEAVSRRRSEGIPDQASSEHHAGRVLSSLQRRVIPIPSENNPLQEFLDACCELHPCAWCRSADLWRAYEQWAEAHQERYPLSRGAFIAQLKAWNCSADRTKSARIWRGIALVKTGDDGG